MSSWQSGRKWDNTDQDYFADKWLYLWSHLSSNEFECADIAANLSDMEYRSGILDKHESIIWLYKDRLETCECDIATATGK